MADGASSNVRWITSERSSLAGTSHMLCSEYSKCGGHLVHNAIVAESREDRLVGHVHAVMTVLSVQSRRNDLIKAFRSIVSEELEIIDGRPPEVFTLHNKTVMEQTLLRRTAIVRARDGEDASKNGKVRQQMLRDAVDLLLAMINGDWTRSPCQHFCCGCCSVCGVPATREQVVDNFVAACIEAVLFGHRTAGLP